MKAILIISLLFLTTILHAQERVLLHINRYGQQEAIPLKIDEQAKDVIERLENDRATMTENSTHSSIVTDTLKYFPYDSELTTNFGFLHQDVAMQWYQTLGDGEILEFWWKNLAKGGNLRKATVRAWYINPKVDSFPAFPNTRFIGTYKDPTDGDGGVTPFKPSTGNINYHCFTEDTLLVLCVDPFLDETPWLRGGLQVTLDSNKWQGIKFNDYSDSVAIKRNQYFGFTISNDTKLNDIGSGVDERMELASRPNTSLAPYHSFKFYERGRTSSLNAGWHMRGDYDWGMYVVLNYTVCRPPKLTMSGLWTTPSTQPRKISVTVAGFSCMNPADSLITLEFYSKVGKVSFYDTTALHVKDGTYAFELPGAKSGDTLYYYCAAYTQNVRVTTAVKSYFIFPPMKNGLLIYNNSTFSLGNAKFIYTGSSNPANFDIWSTVLDGTSEIGTILAFYNNVIVADGQRPSHNIYTPLAAWLGSGTKENKKNLLFTSQDYGCSIMSECRDTLFTHGNWEFDFLGLEKLGPQNLLPADRAHQLLPEIDPVTSYLHQFCKDSSVFMWYDPKYELGFEGKMDVVQGREGAKVLLREGRDQLPVAVKYQTEKFNTMFAALDIGALNLSPDSTRCTTCLYPKYWWINHVKPLSAAFFESVVTGVKKSDGSHPKTFELSQNYPNPFNPSTTIKYQLAAQSHVLISVYNTIGQLVATVVSTVQESGVYSVVFNDPNLSSGIYFYQLRAGGFVETKKMVLMR